MSDEDDSTEDFMFDLMRTLAAFVIFILFLLIMGAVIGGILSWFP